MSGYVMLDCNASPMVALYLGDVRMIAASAPVFVAVLARIFLREPCGVFQIATMTLTMLGVLIVIQPPFLLEPLGLHLVRFLLFCAYGVWKLSWLKKKKLTLKGKGGRREAEDTLRIRRHGSRRRCVSGSGNNSYQGSEGSELRLESLN